MTIFSIKDVEIKISAPMAACMVLWILAGSGSMALAAVCAVFAHELAHCTVAYGLGIKTESIEIYIFGGEAQMHGLEENYAFEAIVACAGPLTSLLLGYLWQNAVSLGVLPVWNDFVEYCYSMAMFNLIPVYPLDGGRILSAAFKTLWGVKKGYLRCVKLGIAASACLMLFNLYELLFFGRGSSIVMAAFITIASLRALKKPCYTGLREKNWYKTQNIKLIKVSSEVKVIDAYRLFAGKSFFILAVVDNDRNVVGMLTEKQVYDGMLSDSTLTLKQWLNRCPRNTNIQ